VTNGSASFVDDFTLALARAQGQRVASVASKLRETEGPSNSSSQPPAWGETWKATVSANLTQVGFDAGMVIVNFTSSCSDPLQQKMKTIYGDFYTVLTRCDLGMEYQSRQRAGVLAVSAAE